MCIVSVVHVHPWSKDHKEYSRCELTEPLPLGYPESPRPEEPSPMLFAGVLLVLVPPRGKLASDAEDIVADIEMVVGMV